MRFISNRESSMTLVRLSWAWRSALIVLMMIVAGSMPARADDSLDREVKFDIAPAMLAKALVEYSLQSGVQLAEAGLRSWREKRFVETPELVLERVPV